MRRRIEVGYSGTDTTRPAGARTPRLGLAVLAALAALVAACGGSRDGRVQSGAAIGAAPLADFHPPSAERRAAAEDILSQVRGPSGGAAPGPGS